MLSKVLKRDLLLIFFNTKWVIKLIIIDQLVKWWFIAHLSDVVGRTITVSSFFDIVYAWNYGVSFGLFSNYYQYSNMVFIILNTIIIAYIWYLMLQSKTIQSFAGYSLIIGGAIGNLIDRIFRGAVFDFLYFHYHQYGFPAFNLADVFITFGVMLLIYDQFKEYQQKKSIEQAIKANYDALEDEAEKIRILDREIAESKRKKDA